MVMQTRQQAIERYFALAGRLPVARFPPVSRRVETLADLVEHVDAFVLDGFGVLNVGERAIVGAVDRVSELQAAGKRVLVLTNGATMPAPVTVEKYRRWGFDFHPDDVVSSRDALAEALIGEHAAVRRWGFAAPWHSQIELLSPEGHLLGDDPADYEAADGFVLLSAADWNDERQQLLEDALRARARPLLVGNPDLVAPREFDLSIEPGSYAHALQDVELATPAFYGKPFANVFRIAKRRLPGIDPSRIVMVGDTLHTDIVGGAAFGWRTALVLDHGLMRETDAKAAIEVCGVRPDFIVGTT